MAFMIFAVLFGILVSNGYAEYAAGCPFHQAICDEIKTPEDLKKFKECYNENAPEYLKEVEMTCKKVVGEDGSDNVGYWKKSCSPDQEDLAKKINECYIDELEKVYKKNVDAVDELQHFMKCIN